MTQSQRLTQWDQLAICFVISGLNAFLFASLLGSGSFFSGSVIGVAHSFFYGYLFSSSDCSQASSTHVLPTRHSKPVSELGDTSGKFFMPEYEDLEVDPGHYVFYEDTFYGLKYFIFGLMSVINLKANALHLAKHGEDCLIVLTHPQEHLVHLDGTVSKSQTKSLDECDYLVVEHLRPDPGTPLKSLMMDFIKGLLEKNHSFPKKIFIPFNDGYHCAGLAIEFYNSEIHVTAFDSMGGTEMTKKATSELKSVIEAVCPTRQVKTVVTKKDQNNDLSCGFHLIFNIFRASSFSGSLFHSVEEANIQNKNAEPFSHMNSAEIFKCAGAVRENAIDELKKLLEINPGKIRVKGKPYNVDLSYDSLSW